VTKIQYVSEYFYVLATCTWRLKSRPLLRKTLMSLLVLCGRGTWFVALSEEINREIEKVT